MSRSFAWRPVVATPPPSGHVSLTIWHLLCTMQGVQEGWTDDLVVTPDDINWLRGAAAATSSDEVRTEIMELLDIVKREGAIEIKVEH